MAQFRRMSVLCLASLGLGVTVNAATEGVSSVPHLIPGTSDDIVVASPNGAVSIAVGVAADGRLTYAVFADDKQIVCPSPLGITIDGQDLGKSGTITGKPTSRKIKETYPIYGHHPLATNSCWEAVIPMDQGGRSFNLVARAYDDGVAVRYDIAGKVANIAGETTAWNLPTDGRYTWSNYDNSYESVVRTTAWDDLPAGGMLSPPLTAEVAGHFVAVTEAANQSFPDMGLELEANAVHASFPPSSKGWDVGEDHVVSPWRVTMVTRDLTALVNSDLVTNLCPAPAADMDFSWVAPGRCMWQWCSIGDPIFADQHDWVDAAVRLKWEYYLIDEGWTKWKSPGKNQWDLLKETVEYGNSKGIKSLVWVNSKEMRDPAVSKAYLERIKALGAVGIKIDFFPPATPKVIRWQLELLKQTAELHLLCNFHGTVKPTGLRRTWPHELTREAVRGDEYQMTKYKRLRPMEMDCNQPFNRFLMGPGDLTPVVMNPKELRGYSWPHMIAQSLVMLSPVTHFYDHYKFYVGSPAEDILSDLPVMWDETRVLPGTVIGEVAGFARRKGDTWWIGVVNGATERELPISLDFLKTAQSSVLLCDVPGKDDALDRQEKALGPGDTLTLKLRPGGGFVARIGPANHRP